ncbi:SLC13 family permease [Actinomadura madurae]|uniref:SLC13 family permease n=1 Tax=Actinomadura madurae TaxID=1993 RepID=UPI002026998A|nr:ArsB/NhaD family transporter [Actinomadura madurae]MCP9950653.1 ArsB/NhaD family transporter [Actinomadura madurae]MCP9967433.1 ArsB/NhaD family transporter [Actinomadura madurae]MCQ0008586.1 ArsB/NhaD family transporter [Actinomadura madurae]MCQ0016095.1 ArsB/NhaD family transporter [Actinomadura madurae]URM96186.1 ArsB/NhaD family transporter [Actinomadura madurae]
MTAVAALAIFVVAFLFIATEKADKVKVVLIAAGAMTVLGLAPGAEVFFSEHDGIDWNVIFLLLGMMIIVGIIKGTGLFDYLAIWAAKRSKGRPYRLLVMLMAITAVASPFLDNVTTIMLVAPVTVVVCDRLRIPAAPYLIAEVLASNIGGASTLIGDPPNIIIASRAGLTFNDFLVHMAPIVVLVFVAFVLLSWVLFRKSFTYDERYVAEVMSLDERKAITDPALLVRCLVVLGLVIVAFMLHSVLHLEPSIVALVGAGVMLLVSRVEVADVLREVEWPVLVFFMGLFVMVAGLGHTGVIEAIGTWAAETIGDNHFVAATSLLFGSAVLGAFFDNIPYAATMAPIVEGMAAGAPDARTAEALWWSFALGADFGGNGTAVAASANVVAIGIAARTGHPISFWQFTRYGIIVTVLSTLMAWVYVALRYF